MSSGGGPRGACLKGGGGQGRGVEARRQVWGAADVDRVSGPRSASGGLLRRGKPGGSTEPLTCAHCFLKPWPCLPQVQERAWEPAGKYKGGDGLSQPGACHVAHPVRPFVFQVATRRPQFDESACISASSRWTRTCPGSCWQGSLPALAAEWACCVPVTGRIGQRALCLGHDGLGAPGLWEHPPGAGLRVMWFGGGSRT